MALTSLGNDWEEFEWERWKRGDFTMPLLFTFLVWEPRSMILPLSKLVFPVAGHISRHTLFIYSFFASVLPHWSNLRRRGLQRIRWLDRITDSVDLSLSKFQETVKDREAQHTAVHGVTKSQTWLGNWTTTTKQSETRNLPQSVHLEPQS